MTLSIRSRLHLLRVPFIASLALFASADTARAGALPTDADSALNTLLQNLEAAGYDTTSTFILRTDNPLNELAWATRVGPYGTVTVNFDLLQGMLDLLNVFGAGLTLDSPETHGFLLFVMAHEFAHLACCHEETPDPVESSCDQMLARINGTNAACSMVTALKAAAGTPLSEFMSTLLHVLCNFIEKEREELNSDDGKAVAAACAALEDAGGYEPCDCSSTSWDPPMSDPCALCPGFPDPGIDPDEPYPEGVVPPCRVCNQI